MVSLDLDTFNTVRNIQGKVIAKLGVPQGEQRLTVAGRPLVNCLPVQPLHLPKGSTIHLALRLRGGSPGRLTRPKPSIANQAPDYTAAAFTAQFEALEANPTDAQAKAGPSRLRIDALGGSSGEISYSQSECDAMMLLAKQAIMEQLALAGHVLAPQKIHIFLRTGSANNLFADLPASCILLNVLYLLRHLGPLGTITVLQVGETKPVYTLLAPVAHHALLRPTAALAGVERPTVDHLDGLARFLDTVHAALGKQPIDLAAKFAWYIWIDYILRLTRQALIRIEEILRWCWTFPTPKTNLDVLYATFSKSQLGIIQSEPIDWTDFDAARANFVKGLPELYEIFESKYTHTCEDCKSPTLVVRSCTAGLGAKSALSANLLGKEGKFLSPKFWVQTKD
ncbi:hypothetical protein Rhopal_004792-T1 [Rhodotorula paludigena]|uniref:Ubiquitin-like domain-containing protein n=1 Tax=Rhodotorula paludigena TaxID=86838 RepID=A0AAV5GPB1_9BASI|nr:hypothetical protein Rhopal_004792-T1 [Rhodotorula paludigena]